MTAWAACATVSIVVLGVLLLIAAARRVICAFSDSFEEDE